MYFETKCIMAVQGHPRLLILVPEQVCNFLLVINSNLCAKMPGFRGIAGFLLKTVTLRHITHIALNR